MLASVAAICTAAPNTGAQEPVQIEEIVVTALKRETLLSATPLAVTALPGTFLDFIGARDFNDYFRRVPGLATVDAGAGRKRYLLRGVSTIETGLSQATVAQYVDDIPITDSFDQQPNPRLIDIDRVEVLRGPQGTLFGARAMAGTIRTITRKPNLARVQGSASATFSQTKFGGTNGNLEAVINVPLITDELAVRAAAFYSSEDGYIDNNFPGRTFVFTPNQFPPGVPVPPPVTIGPIRNSNFTDVEFAGVRVSARWVPIDRLTLDVMSLLQDGKVGGAPFFDAVQTGDEANGLVTAIVGSTGNDDKLYIGSATLTYDFDFASLTAVGAYTKRDNFGLGAANVGGPLGGGTAGTTMNFGHDIGSWTFETRIASATDSPFQWIVGGYAFTQDRDGRSQQQIAFGARTLVDAIFSAKTEEYAAFGEASYKFLEAFTLTAGVRYSDYKNRLNRNFLVAPPGAQLGPDPNPPRFSEDNVTLKVQAGYAPTKDLLVYVLASQGFRPGGFNPNAQPGFINIPVNFDSDSLWNYELGAKTSWFDRRLTVNGAVYRIDWTDMQVQSFIPAPVGPNIITFATNASASRIIGLELEASARVTQALSLDFAFNHFFKNELVKDGPISPIGLAPRAGDPLSFNPRTSFNIGAEYRRGLWEDVDGFLRIDWSYTGRRFTGFRPALNNGQVNNLYNNLAPYHLVNLRIGASSGPIRGTFYIDNAGDSRPALQQQNAPQIPATLRVTARPRTFGVTLSASY